MTEVFSYKNQFIELLCISICSTNQWTDFYMIGTFVMKEFKSGSHLPKKIHIICFIESPLKIVKNAFYHILKALFVLKI